MRYRSIEGDQIDWVWSRLIEWEKLYWRKSRLNERDLDVGSKIKDWLNEIQINEVRSRLIECDLYRFREISIGWVRSKYYWVRSDLLSDIIDWLSEILD